MCCDGNANGNIARYNVSQNDGCIAGSRVFLVHGHGNHNYRVHNNAVYAGRGNPAMFQQGADSSGSSILFKNNIFINAGTGSFRAPKGCQFENNSHSAGSETNLFDAHSRFQVDGDLGVCPGITEMLLQSSTGEIHLLPALPPAWPDGKVTGLRACGNLTVDIEWKDGKVTKYRIASTEPREVKVRVNGEMKLTVTR